MSANHSVPKYEPAVLVLVAFIVAMVLTCYVVLSLGGKGTGEFIALAAGPLVTTVVGAVLGKRIHGEAVAAERDLARAESMSHHPAGTRVGGAGTGDPGAA